MKAIVVASMRRDVGKTTLIIGLAQAAGGRLAYLKPFGDRHRYKKKRVWDADAALVSEIFALRQQPEQMSLGFDHAKLRYMYTPEALAELLVATRDELAAEADLLLVEAGGTIGHGSAVHLDGLAIARALDAPLLFVAGGEDAAIADDVAFLRSRTRLEEGSVVGVVANKVSDPEDFRASGWVSGDDAAVPLLGTLPFLRELTQLSVAAVVEHLFAKVLAGADNLQRPVATVVVGAMSSENRRARELISGDRVLVITGGDRSDMILAAIEEGAAALLLTNDVAPASNLLALAEERAVPVLLVPDDTYRAARQIDRVKPLLQPQDRASIELLAQAVRDSVDMGMLLR